MNTNYKISSKKRYIKRNKERKNKENKLSLSLSNFDVLKSNNDYEIFISKIDYKLKEYKEIYPKCMWRELDIYFPAYISNDNGCITHFNNDENIKIILTSNIMNKYKQAIKNYIKKKLKYIILNKLKMNYLLKYLNTGKLITEKLVYILDNSTYFNYIYYLYQHQYTLDKPYNNISFVKQNIFYDLEKFKQYFLNYYVKEKLKIYQLFSISKNPSKNYLKYQYLLCIISIMRQKFNFQDHGFCNYLISFL